MRISIIPSYADESQEIINLLKESTQDPYLGNTAITKSLDDLLVFFDSGTPVGFANPTRFEDGYYRTGPIYITESYRGMGIAGGFLREYFADKKGRVFIAESNVSSHRLFCNYGFEKRINFVEDVILDRTEKLFEYTKEVLVAHVARKEYTVHISS